MPKFAVGDVVRVLGNAEVPAVGPGGAQAAFYKEEKLDKLVGTVQKVTRTAFENYLRSDQSGDAWFDANQCEIAQIQVGDRVICEKWEGQMADDPHFAVMMGPVVGKVGIVTEVGATVRVKFPDSDDYWSREYGWYWPVRAVKFALEGDVPVAPQQAAVEAPKALGEDVPKMPVAVKKPKKKEAIIRNLRAEMNKQANKRHPGTASYALQFKDGSTRFQISDICHARVIRGYREYKEVARIATAVQPFYKRMDAAQKRAYKRYVDYITKRSPYAVCFLPVSSAIRYSVYLNLERSHHNIAAACIALREGSEYSAQNNTFVWLLKQGVSEDAAWVASRIFVLAKGKDGAKSEYNFKACRGHDAITADTDKDKFFATFKDGLYMNDKPYNESNHYEDGYRVYACFGQNPKALYGDNETPNSLGKHAKKIAGVVLKGVGWDTKQYTPGSGVIKAAKWIDEEIAKARAA